MAVPQDFEAYGSVGKPAGSEGNSLRPTRTAMVAIAMLMTMVAALALLASTSEQSGVVVEIAKATSPDAKLEHIVSEFLKAGKTMSLKDMEQKLDDWRHDPNTMLELPEHSRMQVLAHMANKMQSLADDSSVCSAKEQILDKFDELLRKLGTEELDLNITNAHVQDQLKAAVEAYLASESSYRLTVEKAKQAKDGSEYAQQEYEKYNTAYQEAVKSHAVLQQQDTTGRASLLAEQELIQQVLQMIGVLNSTSASAKGTQQLYQKTVGVASIEKEIAKLQAMTTKNKHSKLALFAAKLKTTLKQYGESDQITVILKQMLQDIADRIRVLDNLDTAATQQVTTLQGKVTEWQTKLIDLSNAADEANAEAESEALQRQTLAGKKEAAAASAKEEAAAYKMTMPPYSKEIYVIILIKKKITDYCDAQAAA